jgi:hypothetical protein
MLQQFKKIMDHVINMKEVRAIGTRVFSGQPRGKHARQLFELDTLDREDGTVTINIPPDTYSIGPSFLLGLFGPSIVRLGKPGFYAKYKFPWNSILLDSLNETVARAAKTSTVLVA